MNYFEPCLRWFQALSKQRQWSLLGAGLLIFIVTFFLIIWVSSPSYGILFNRLDTRDANKILAQLEKANIAYQVRNQGSEILIDRRLIDKTRIKLIGSGLQLTNSVGFELFDKTDFGMTEFSQKINFQRALQGELERTITSLDEIDQARVHLVIPESHLFHQDDNLPRAAVTLHLKHALTRQQVSSIQQLVAASVPKLPLTNVIIVDQNGNNLIHNEDDSGNNHFEAKKKVEHYLNEKVMQMLNRIFIHQQVLVKIDATLNYDELQRERLKPQRDGLITHEKETKHSTSNKAGKTPYNQDYTREKSYQLGREKERFIRANGTIERLTISVIVPQKTSSEIISQVEHVVKSVVGFDAKRGDSISVEALLVEEKARVIKKIEPPAASRLSHSLVYSVAIAITLVFLLALLRYRKKRAERRQPLLNELQVQPKPLPTLPDYCQQLANKSPLYVAIVLEQAAYPWEDQFLDQFDSDGVIRNALANQVVDIKPLTRQRLFRDWEDSHG